MIFLISETLDKAEKIMPATFVGLNIWERIHIEEWVRTNPDILGEELFILTTEFDRFTNSSDRLDILALDRLGNLVIIELKRDSISGYADLQAIRYAAMVSSMTVAKLLPYYIAYRKKHYNEVITEIDARSQMVEFVESDAFAEFSTRPRIILCSEGFSQEITTTVLWLNASQLDITCVEIIPYRVGSQTIIAPKVVIPLAEAKEYLIDIKTKEEEREQSVRASTRPKTMKTLVENGLVKKGESIFLKNDLPSHVQYKDGEPMFQATITGKLGQSNAVRWSQDGLEYSVSALAAKIFKDLHPDKKDSGAVNGNLHWVAVDGRPLWAIADEFINAKVKQ